MLHENDLAAGILLSNKDVYYLSGTSMSSVLLVPAEGDAVLLVLRNYERAREESHLTDVRQSTSFTSLKEAVAEKGLTRSVIGLVQDTLPTTTYLRLTALLSEAKFVDMTRLAREVRMIKDADEIEKIRRAASIADFGHQVVCKTLRPGLTELEVSFAVELEMIRKGHDGCVLTRSLADIVRGVGIVSAPNLYAPSSLPLTMPGQGSTPIVTWGPSKRELVQGEVVMVDLCGTFDGYITDEARTYVLGKATTAQKEITEAVEYVIQETMGLMKPGTVASEIFLAAQAAAERTSYGAYFLGGKERNIRFVGHGLGLELDELPMITPNDTTVLAPGMVIAYEPIIMVPGIGAATLENTLLITEEGNEILTKRPIKLIEL